MSSRQPEETDGYVMHPNEYHNSVELEDASGIFGKVEDITSSRLGAHNANIARVTLWEPDVLHLHKEAEETYFCLEEEGLIYLGNGDVYPFRPGYSVTIDQGTLHAAMPKSPCRRLIFICVSSPPFNSDDVFPDPRGRMWYKH
jgi:mannose-6-phosphate isomerase-like protein (cupin superfamily)